MASWIGADMRDDNPCFLDGCASTRVWGTPLCHNHYLPPNVRGPVEQRFWSKVSIGTVCWMFTGKRKSSAYPGFRVKDRIEYAHRVAYAFAVGELIPGMVIDHICLDPTCVKPDHLRQVTQAQNSQHHRGATGSSKSGVRGVFFHQNRWIAAVQHNGKRVYYRRFRTLEEAEAAVIEARKEIFTHNDVDRSVDYFMRGR